MPVNPTTWLATAPLPALWQGRRRKTTTLLLATGIGQGLLAVGAGVVMSSLTKNAIPTVPIVIALAIAAITLGALRIAETILAERLGQQYVAQARRLLVHDALGPTRSPNVGITIARATNDLAAVRNWVVLGIARIVAGVPLIIGVLIALAVLSIPVALGVGGCLIALGIALYALAPAAFRRYRMMRRARGRMASFVADAVRAAPGIQAAGGITRELKNVDKLSLKVEKAAVATATTVGAMRGAAAAIGTVLLLVATVLAVLSGVNATTLTTVLLLTAVLSGPTTDLGRIAEYRQGFNAARVVLTPVMQRAYKLVGQSENPATHRPKKRLTPHQIHIGGLDGISDLIAEPGTHIALTWNKRQDTDPVFDALLGNDFDSHVSIGRTAVHLNDDLTRRAAIGYVSATMEVEQGPISRAVRYRRPNTKLPIDHLLNGLGLKETIKQLPKGAKTKLRRGGEPLTAPERMKLLIARALYSTPPILLLSDLSLRLCVKDLAIVRDIIAHYPGVVIVMDDDWQSLVPAATLWDMNCTRRVVMAEKAQPNDNKSAVVLKDAAH